MPARQNWRCDNTREPARLHMRFRHSDSAVGPTRVAREETIWAMERLRMDVMGSGSAGLCGDGATWLGQEKRRGRNSHTRTIKTRWEKNRGETLDNVPA